MRRVFFPSAQSADDLVSARELGRASFALLVEYVAPTRGRYRIKARIQPRNAEIAERIKRHRLHEVAIYIDKAAEVADERQAALTIEMEKGLDADGLGYIWSPHRWMWSAAKKSKVWFDQQKAVRVTFGSLLAGMEIVGEMGELQRLVRAMNAVVDRLASQIDTGAAFDAGEIRIYAPGSRVKIAEDKTGTAPSEWES